MIANFTRGADPGGLVRYLLGYQNQKIDKQATVLGSAGVRTDTLAHLVKDFEVGGMLHPELGQAVVHISLSFNPDDAARMSDQKMRQVAEEYLEEMGMTGTQYLLVRHRDRPHQHLHIMANRVADDGHTIEDSNNFLDSKTALDKLIARHELSPAKGNRPHLQHPKRLRGGDLGRSELRTALDQELEKEKQTQRPALLAALLAKGIAHREFHDQDGNVTGISFRTGGYACKGSALGPEYSSAGLDKRLAANRQNALEAVSAPRQSSVLPDQAPTAARGIAAQPLAAPIVPVLTGEELPPPVSAPLLPPAGPAEGKPSGVSAPVAGRTTPLVATAVAAASVRESAPTAPVQAGNASSVLPGSSWPIDASVGGELRAGPATPVERLANQGAEASAPDSVVSARAGEGPLVGPVLEGSTAALREGQEAPVLPRYATPAEQVEWDRQLAAWEHKLEEQAYWDRREERYYDLLAETTRKIAVAEQGYYQSLPAFEVLMHTQGLALLPAQGEQPARVVHQSSGEVFPAEDVLLAGRPFLDTVQAKAARAAEAAVPSPPAVVDWEPRYRQYLQQRAGVLAHNKAVIQVNWQLEDHPNAAGVAAAIALVRAPGTPPLGNGHLLQNLQVELTRQQNREDEIRGVTQERARLQEVAKGRFGFAYTTAAMEARDRLRYLEAPPMLPLQVGERRYLLPEPPALTQEQFTQQQQVGLEQVRASVKAALAAGFMQWREFKFQVDYHGIETTLSDAGAVAFRHKASGQTYRSDEVMTNLKEQYGEAKARGLAQEAQQPQWSALAKGKDQELSI